ncbi:MAG: hypothetical protein ABI625_04835 [bacterium]
MKIIIPQARTRKKAAQGPFRFLRPMALFATVLGATGSVGAMFRVGQRNPSKLLLLAFLLWDASPFVALLLADRMSKGWTLPTRKTLYSLMLILTLGSLAIYGYIAFGPPRKKPAAMFLIVPAASWLLMSIAIPMSARISRAPLRRRSTST